MSDYDNVQRDDVPPQPDPRAEDQPPDDAEVMITLGSSTAAVTEFDELTDTIPDEPEDSLDH